MKTAIPLEDRIIFALDVDSPEDARQWVALLGGHIRFFKIGLQLFLAGGFGLIEELAQQGHKVMVDLKLFDIDKTVELAVRELAKHPVTFTTVHGPQSIVQAAVTARGHMRILAVTVLTSFDRHDLEDLGLPGVEVEQLVLSRARRAMEAGCDGVVASGQEVAKMRKIVGDGFLIVTPGIRPGSFADAAGGDEQKRVSTAREAILAGADHVVVGRPIKNATDPLAVVKALQQEICEGLRVTIQSPPLLS
ncbi:MAG: Orotidine 5'-phosphate decarboxylase [Magnetococcales bacterium]|nr:Orotidine 5'-phosphate decarboxylase [Magnetococcales bacterium]HIJ83746.1 orotidine-5'-phosphate decarboxylase [Magnetococcales bacterium]